MPPFFLGYIMKNLLLLFLLIMPINAYGKNKWLTIPYWQNATIASVQNHIDAGANINARNKYAFTPLMFAVAYSANPKIISLLLKNGAHIHATSRGKLTPIMRASRHNPNPEIIDILIKNGAKIHARDGGGFTPLIRAAQNNPNPEIITTLLKHGADINAQDRGGYTPLMWAVLRNKNPHIITTLIKNGADKTLKSHSRKTAWDYIKNNKKLKNTPAYNALAQ